jgi:hypothetical protein
LSEVLGIVNALRQDYWTGASYFEALVFAKDRVIVVRHGQCGSYLMRAGARMMSGWGRARIQTKLLIGRSPEELLNASEDNYAIPIAEIERVELKKIGVGAFVNIITREKKRGWAMQGLAGEEKTWFREYENLLRPVFNDRLVILKSYASVKAFALALPLIVGTCLLLWYFLSTPEGWVFAVVLLVMLVGAVVAGLLVQLYFNKQLREA